MLNHPMSVTGSLMGKNINAVSSRHRSIQERCKIKVTKAIMNNLKNVDVSIPLNTLTCVTGVSGSGKSSLVRGVILNGFKSQFFSGKKREKIITNSGKSTGWEPINKVLDINHNPIGRTPRSIPASYVGFLDNIRKLFSVVPSARARGYRIGRFSFNLSGGRCEACKGQGQLREKMHLLPDVYVLCEMCRGKRFNAGTLQVTYKKKTISDILEMTFAEALQFFSKIPKINKAVQCVCNMGLGYLRLGQSCNTLSGGEAQRIKLARQLAKPSAGHTLYIMDEPTTGLHLADVILLMKILQQLVDDGNTVIAIEHNLEFICGSDYIIDMGPDGGDLGGHVVATGSPEELASHSDSSHTGWHILQRLNQSDVAS